MITRDVAIAKAEQALREHRLDALVAVSPWNVFYTSGTSFLTQRTIPERLGMVVLTPGSEPTFIYCTIEDGHARGESWITDLRGYTEFKDKPIGILVDVLRERGAGAGRVGIEKRFLVAQNYDELRAALPEAQLVEADSIFDRMRAVKTPEEIAHIGRAASITDEAIRIAFEAARIGDTERSIGDRMIAETRARGANSLLFQVVATGENARKAHPEPGETRLEAGGIIRTDFGMFWNGYVSDIARTALIAPVDPAKVEVYKRLEEIHQTVIAAMRPGTRACDLYRLCAESFARHGLDFNMPHIGHSVGLGVHENPMMHPYDETELVAGMLFMLEPIAFTGDGLFHTEDLIEVTDQGGRILSRSCDWSEPLIIGG